MKTILLLILLTMGISFSKNVSALTNHIKTDLSNNQGENQRESIIILSPEPNEKIIAEDILISFSILNLDTTTEKPIVKIFLNEVELSSSLYRSGDIFILQPDTETIRSGSQTVRVELHDHNGNIKNSSRWSFLVTRRTETVPQRESLKYSGSIQLETRHENLSTIKIPLNRANINISSFYGDFRFHGRLYVTDEEKSYRQPQHRFLIGAESKWLSLNYGDNCPSFPSMIMSGMRVRGLSVNLSSNVFNLDYASGQIIRSIEGTPLDTIRLDTLITDFDTTAAHIRLDSLKLLRIKPGAYERNIVIIRPSFGSRNKSHFGLTYLKSKDNVKSILYGNRPQENFVLGSDLFLTLDNRNIEFKAQAAFSSTNRDISSGTISDDMIDSLEFINESDRSNIKKYKNILSRLITVNTFLVPLSYEKMPTLSYEGILSLNYFNNQFKFNYLRHGVYFESFGQSAIRTDIVGFSLSDRFRIFKNTLGVGLELEKFQDNTANTKPFTTKYTNLIISLSYFPRFDFPALTLGYYRATTKNPLKRDEISATDDETNRISFLSSYRFQFYSQHYINFMLSTSGKNDLTNKNFDSRITTISINNATTYNIPLQTNLGIVYTANSIPLRKLNYISIVAGAQYLLLEDKLILSGMLSPTIGDINRTAIDASVRYYLLTNLSTQFQTNVYMNSGNRDDFIWSLTLRLDI